MDKIIFVLATFIRQITMAWKLKKKKKKIKFVPTKG